MMLTFDLIVVGGGAAGFYGAIQVAETSLGSRILILEKSNKLLSKVRVSGGGRCNVTHNCDNPNKLAQHYPRGEKFLKKIFKQHAALDSIKWFQGHGIQLKTEEDGRMFPVTDSSETIISCFLEQAHRHAIKINLGEGVEKIFEENGLLKVQTSVNTFLTYNVLIACGGHPSKSSYDWITRTNHLIKDPIPSLFTFNAVEKTFIDLMGVSVPNASVRILGTRYEEVGPVLITHWGLSGPAVIKLSAWAAEHLHCNNYAFKASVNWLGEMTEEEVRSCLTEFREQKGKQRIRSNSQFGLPSRLWIRLCELAEIPENKIWSELALKNQNRLMEFLIRCPFEIKGKTTFKEEFVTCGGVDLSQVDVSTMMSTKTSGLFFAGEVLNIDGETGGFNFQAAWSTAYVASQAIVKRLSRQTG